MTEVFRSWGGLIARDSKAALVDHWRGMPGTVLPFGNGRSYGDTCLLDHGTLIDSRTAARLQSLDAETGLAILDAGLMLSDLIEAALPLGWFPPVTPGTRFVTLGGAIANDVHGKNHHRSGTLGTHVEWLELERSDHGLLRCSRTENPDLFAATIGGMGLTGLIRRIALRMKLVRSALIDQETLPFASLDEFFRIAAESDRSWEYSVAWIDSRASGSALGRGVYFRGNHLAEGPLAIATKAARLGVPFQPPFSMLNSLSLAAFNAAYRFAHRRVRRASVPFGPFFYPLDGIRNWNRLYGPRGLRQFQCVVPMATAKDSVAALLLETQKAKAASFLTVLKLFGEAASPGLLSFPMPGATLTLDFPYHGAKTDQLLARLDSITLAAGGRVNPYKDARLSAEVFRASFPHWERFRAHVDPRFSSRFWQRVSA